MIKGKEVIYRRREANVGLLARYNGLLGSEECISATYVHEMRFHHLKPMNHLKIRTVLTNGINSWQDGASEFVHLDSGDMKFPANSHGLSTRQDRVM